KGGESRRLYAATAYHAGRLLAYGSIGALCGALGQQPLLWFFDSPFVVLPWLLVLVFLLIATGLSKRLPRPTFLNRLLTRARLGACRISATKGGFAMGLATPLLPCAPLYLLFGATLLSGSALRGAEFALAFGLGTVPLLWLAQHSFQALHRRLSPLTLLRLQRTLALLAALLIALRLHDTLPLFGELQAAEPQLPGCCH
ncbi:MAG: sulfite exporter TauE/SafE family protein, partial [Verrucomicrobia bacterium]|nr:sulfite exporter TauE/SafE family protein [Verrucomicrobiota bacterium]